MERCKFVVGTEDKHLFMVVCICFKYITKTTLGIWPSKIERPGQNLFSAFVQFHLLKSVFFFFQKHATLVTDI